MIQSRDDNRIEDQCTVSYEERMAILEQTAAADPLLNGYDDPSIPSIQASLPEYEIVKLINRGGQGTIYLAVKDDRSLAIKVLRDGITAGSGQARRLRREIAFLKSLDHPGIVAVFDSGAINENQPYLVMRYIIGNKIDVHAAAENLSLHDRIRLFLQACSAVSFAHSKGIIHRDLKPSNMLVECEYDKQDNETPHVRLLDFGLAKKLFSSDDCTLSSELSKPGHRVGTARYSSPEQISGQTVGIPSDIYSLGVVLFEMLSGEMPYATPRRPRSSCDIIMRGERIRLREAIRNSDMSTDLSCAYKSKDVGRDLETVLETALAVEPALRYATVDEFADDLRRYVDGKPVKAHIGVGQRIRAIQRTYRRRFAAAAAVALVTTLSAVAGFAWHSAEEAGRRERESARISQSAVFMAGFVRLASAHYDAQKPDQAITVLQHAIDLASHVPPTKPIICRQAYQAYYNMAEYYFETDRPEEARPYCEKAIELSDALQGMDPADLLFMRLGSYSHRLSGRVSYATGDWAEAMTHFETMLAVRALLADREPDVPHRQIEVADAHTWIGRAARKAKHVDRALAHDAAACRTLSALLDTHPEEADHAVRLSNAEGWMASDYMHYRTVDANGIALEILSRARRRLLELDAPPSLKHRIAANLTVINANIAKLHARSTS